MILGVRVHQMLVIQLYKVKELEQLLFDQGLCLQLRGMRGLEEASQRLHLCQEHRYQEASN